jgi:GT2 family glycosyltransferase
MNRRPKIVLLGMVTKMPVAGVTWLVAQYAIGFRRLGFDVYYVEAHARTPSMFMTHADDDATSKAVEFLASELGRFGFGDSWAFHALHDDGRCYGMSRSALDALYNDADLIINMHGGTLPLDEHAATGRLAYLGTDPGEVEFELERGDQRAIDALSLHTWFFTWGLNYGNPDCKLPWSSEFPMTASPPPVVLDLWQDIDIGPGTVMTTIGNWRQPWRNVTIDGETYRWSKHHEFLKVIELPERVARPFELALASYEPQDQQLLESHGWAVRPATTVSSDSESYRRYICASRGEFSVAKDQNVRFRSGWFSERSACYLAAGRPVVLQDTAFGSFLPSGEGVLAFSDLDGAVAAVESVNSDYQRHRRAARDVAREYLDSDVVLRAMLAHCGISAPVDRRSRLGAAKLPTHLELTPRTRRPLVLVDSTMNEMTRRPVPSCRFPGSPLASIVMVTHDNVTVTRMAAESILTSSDDIAHELIIVDNASTDGTQAYLEVLASRNAHVRFVSNSTNTGFAKAVNQGLSLAVGDVLVVVNNDVIVTPSWLSRLTAHLDQPDIAAVGPVTNRCGNHAEIPADYRTYGEMVAFDAERAGGYARTSTSLPMLTMFCMAMKRAVFETIGPLDERFEIGFFEDDDYGRRIRAAGMRLVCAEDVFVHHFGEAAFSQLYAGGERSKLFEENRQRYQEKWGIEWQPHTRRPSRSYDVVVDEVRDIASELIGSGAVVAVISKGDDRMVHVPCGTARHFPGLPDGSFIWSHPANDDDAISALVQDENAGLTHLVFPESAFWWLDHYTGFKSYLADRYDVVPTSSANVLVFHNLRSTEARRCQKTSAAS